MKMKLAGALLLACGLTLAAAGSGLALGSADDMINARQAEMKTNMKAMKALVSMLKGETPYDNAAVQAAAGTMRQAHAANVTADVWNASSQSGATVKSEAKAEIWSDPQGFAAAWTPLDKAVSGIEASHDEASFKAAFPALGAACKGCHEKFRAAD